MVTLLRYIVIIVLSCIITTVVYEWKRPVSTNYLEEAKKDILQEIRRETKEGRVFLICSGDDCIKFIPRKGDKSINVKVSPGVLREK